MKECLFEMLIKKLDRTVEEGNFTPPHPEENERRQHEGNIGNLMNDKIAANMKTVIESFHFEKYHKAIDKLISA